MISLGHLIFLGVMERFPNLRVSFLEGNAGWLPFWLGRLNDHGMREKRQGMWYDMEEMPLKPSEYFLRQGFVACDPDEFHLKGVVDALGDDNIVWNTDYSHPDAPTRKRRCPTSSPSPSATKASAKSSGTTPSAYTEPASSPERGRGFTPIPTFSHQGRPLHNRHSGVSRNPVPSSPRMGED